MRSHLTILALCCTALSAASRSDACCMPPKDYAGRIGQNGQKALLIHHDGREELILGIDYHITPEITADTGKPGPLPPNFAWIITVPNEPDAYAVADIKLFDDLSKFTESLLPKPRDKDNWSDGRITAPAGVELGKRVQVGPYDIQPVRGVGPGAFDGLNTWLAANGFPTEDRDHMAWFIERNFTFLCVKVKPEEGKKEVGSGGPIPPLHLSFKSEKPYYPLKFSSRQGIFDVNIWLLTKPWLSPKENAEVLKRLNAEFIVDTSVTRDKLPASAVAVLDKSRLDEKTRESKDWNFALLRAVRVNDKTPISSWTDDVYLAAK